MIQGNKTRQRDPKEIKQQAGERNPEISLAPRNAAISEIASPWNRTSAVPAVLPGPGCAHPALALRAHTKTNSSYPEIPQSFAKKTHFEVFFPPS